MSDIPYDELVAGSASSAYEPLVRHLADLLPELWCASYDRAAPHATNITCFFESGFEYFFDFSTALVRRQVLPEQSAVEDRVVAVHGLSHPGRRRHRDRRIRAAPRGAAEVLPSLGGAEYDRGHFVAHAVGGSLHVNLFPQLSTLNRGISHDGKRFRSMERYCARHPGTYSFVRPLYAGLSAHPAVIEMGVLRLNGSLWVESFRNTPSDVEMAQIESLLRAKRQGA